MTDNLVWRPRARKLSRIVRGFALIVLVVGPALVGCEGSADSPFIWNDEDLEVGPERNFTRIAPGAMRPTGDQCGGLVGGEATKELVFIDSTGGPIKPGDDLQVVGSVDPRPEDVRFDNEAIYSFPDVACAGDGDCPSGLQCHSGSNRCRTGTDVAVTGLDYSEDNAPETQALAVVMADAGAWRGWYSTELDGYYPFDPDAGEPVDSGERLESLPAPELAVDRDNRRSHAVATMANFWETVQGYVGEEERQAYFGLWTFEESTPGEITSKVRDVHADQEVWTDDGDVARLATHELSRDPGDSRANVYASLNDVLHDIFDAPATAGELDALRVVVVVPGHDEVRQSSADDVIENVNQRASQTGTDISVSIVQVDAARDVSRIPDDWAYYTDQAPCFGDGDCTNFETCREPTWYTFDSGATDEGDVDYPREEQRGESFCMPDYDEHGRLGPIADYDRIACETGGAYYYMPEISQQLLEEYLQAQVWASEASWQMEVVIDNLIAGQPALLEANLEVTIGRSRSYRFEREREDRDRRRVLFGGP